MARGKKRTPGHQISFRCPFGTPGVQRRTGRSTRSHVTCRWKNGVRQKLRSFAWSAATNYANSLTNVSCNRIAIYQTINSAMDAIYGRVPELSACYILPLFLTFLPLSSSTTVFLLFYSACSIHGGSRRRTVSIIVYNCLIIHRRGSRELSVAC